MVVDAEDGQVTFSGFDYESSAQLSVPAEVADSGRVLVSGRLLSDICRSMPGDSVDISGEASRVEVSSGSSRFMLHSLPLDQYPSLPELPRASGVIAGDVLARAVAQVVSAAGRDDTLPVFTGIRLEIRGTTISLLATDRYRLAVRTFPWEPVDPSIDINALVPAKLLSDVAKAMAGHELTLALGSTGTGDGLMGFEAGGRRATSRLIDGEFPKVRNLIPAESAITTTVTVDTAALIEAVKRVALVAERSAPVRLMFADGVATLDAGNGEEAQASEAVEVTLTGDPVVTGFNAGYLLDGLASLGAPIAHFAFGQPTRPANLTGLRSPDEAPSTDSAYILMPMRLPTAVGG